MSRDPARRVEEILRSDAKAVRREPSAAFGAKVRATIAATPDRDSTIADPEEGHRGRRRLREACVAASVLAAAGLWIFAFAGGIGSGSGAAGNAAPVSDSARPDRADGSSLLAELARVTPRALGAAVDESLLGELDRMMQDATRTARFLAGRVPASLVPRASGEGPR